MAKWYSQNGVGYNSEYTPAQNVITGRQGAHGQTYTKVYEQLLAASNEFLGKTSKPYYTQTQRDSFKEIAYSFKRAADLALRMHYEVEKK